mgnify:CR=1 FL=1
MAGSTDLGIILRRRGVDKLNKKMTKRVKLYPDSFLAAGSSALIGSLSLGAGVGAYLHGFFLLQNMRVTCICDKLEIKININKSNAE